MLDAWPNLVDFRDRCFGRPAYQKAIADQMADFSRHGPADMKYN
jgi:hypothetical protein